MSGTEVVEIGAGSAVECSKRLLSAVRSGSLPAVGRELSRAQRVANAPVPAAGRSALAEEQAELLDAIAGRMRLSLKQYDPSLETEIFLLGHLSRQ